jgi:hypothetical protein
MMGPHLGSGFLHEEVASLRATIAAIDIAEVFEAKRPTALSNLRGRGNGYGTIDDRFCVESGHRSAAHVLDIQDMASDELIKHAPFLLESVSPACMVRDDLYRTLLEADHASSCAWIRDTAEKSYCPPSDLRRDVIISIPGNVLRYSGLKLARTRASSPS